MSAPTPLPKDQVAHFLAKHPDWKLEGVMLARTYEAPSFLEAITFVGQVAKLAESADHHPDIDIRWRKVTLRFVTHDAGHQVTALDTRLAGECDVIFRSLHEPQSH
jgi:4a-hydroxytetrahydrobiopterin dehydratase